MTPIKDTMIPINEQGENKMENKNILKTINRFKKEFTIRREKYKKAEDDLCRLFLECNEELEEWFESALECTVEDFYYHPWAEELNLYLFTDKAFDEVNDKILSLNLPFNVHPIIIESDEDKEI